MSEPGWPSPQVPPPRLIGPVGRRSCKRQQETPIGATYEVQTKRRKSEGGSIHLLGFLPSWQPIKGHRDAGFLEFYI